ncbi:MAG: Mrp/NBP35 family ATP-binding protein [Acidimicrobiales bacterium]|nr:Mrp/NBP35 family ATP-binding protein [Acidimicrobiales bacterium]
MNFPEGLPIETTGGPNDLIMAVIETLRGVIDPELGENVVDLNMVERVDVLNGNVTVGILLTTAKCPLRSQIKKDVQGMLLALEEVKSVEIVMSEMSAIQKASLMDLVRKKAQDKDAIISTIPINARVLAISSGKGGVGKSSITANLAVALAKRGLSVGVLDADIWGFSIPRLLGINESLKVADKKIVPIKKPVGDGSISVVSMGFLAEEESAVMWRGLILNRAVQHFLEDVDWSGINYLLIDMPPGTGDIQMGLARMLPRSEVIIVTTPPYAAQAVAARAGEMAKKSHIRVAGVIENMSKFVCDHGVEYALFGSGGGERLAKSLGVPLIGEVPLDPSLPLGGDIGVPVALENESNLSKVFDTLGEKIVTQIAPIPDLEGCSVRMLNLVEEAIAREN